jgi:superkiller protein 3
VGNAERAREKYALGRSLEEQNQPGAAIAAYRTALLFDPALPDAAYRIGLLFLTRDVLAEAAKFFALEIQHHPENDDAVRELGLTLTRLGRHDRAIDHLTRLTKRSPNHDENWRALGFAYAAAGRKQDAEAAFRRAIQLGLRRAEEHRDLAVLLASEGRDREARAEYQLALEVEPKDATVWYNLGNLDRRAKQPQAALENFRRATAYDSTFGLAMQGEVAVLRDLKRDAEAGEVYRRWLRANPLDHETRLAAVRLYDDIGRNDVAVEIGLEGVRRAPRSAEAHRILGLAYEANSQSRLALEELRRSASLFGTGDDSLHVVKLIGTMRARAPDSLRAVFAADSAAHPGSPR